eukprot:3480418-Amphidinium_carterae.1
MALATLPQAYHDAVTSQVLGVMRLVMVAAKSAASDSSAYVRKTAAQCMTKVFSVPAKQISAAHHPARC